MSEPKTYHGSCHCGRVRYEVKLDLTQPVVSCNCSICQRLGTLLQFVPAEQFVLTSAEHALTDYQWGTKNTPPLFCSTCGVRSFARGIRPTDGSSVVAINTRCLEGIEVRELSVKHFNGRAI